MRNGILHVSVTSDRENPGRMEFDTYRLGMAPYGQQDAGRSSLAERILSGCGFDDLPYPYESARSVGELEKKLKKPCSFQFDPENITVVDGIVMTVRPNAQISVRDLARVLKRKRVEFFVYYYDEQDPLFNPRYDSFAVYIIAR